MRNKILLFLLIGVIYACKVAKRRCINPLLFSPCAQFCNKSQNGMVGFNKNEVVTALLK